MENMKNKLHLDGMDLVIDRGWVFDNSTIYSAESDASKIQVIGYKVFDYMACIPGDNGFRGLISLDGKTFYDINEETLKVYEPESMPDPVIEVEMMLKNSIKNMKPFNIIECKYLLPCGKCDKTDEMCSQYMETKLNGNNNRNEQ